MSSKSQPAPVDRPDTPTPQLPSGLKSMTGYGESRLSESGFNLHVAVRSVNHRFLDLHLRMPEGFEPIEPRVRKVVRQRLRRGHLDVTVRHELAGPSAVGVNQDVAAAYLDAVNVLRKRFGVSTQPDLATILRLPGVIGPGAALLDEDLPRLEELTARCLAAAIDKLDRMREEEGAALLTEMSGRLSRITSLTAKVETLAERARPVFAKRLEMRLKELLGEAPLDPARLAQEAALAAQRGDVSEEIARLASHVGQFATLLSGGADVGKKLDFLLQEMQREANTLLSKTPGNDAEGLEITALALEIKSEIEKLREQVQNIE
jgi:uncharacterized protein (TIGR00255 family)